MPRTAATAVAGLLFFLAAAAHSAGAEIHRKANDPDLDQIKALQEERIEVLTQLVKLTTTWYQMGQVTFNEVVSAQRELIAAKLDATDEPEKRVALLTQHLGLLAELLKLTEARQAAGRAAQADVFQAKSLYLDAKIKLLRERRRHKPAT